MTAPASPVALVTGCGKDDGIGWSTALALSQAGHAVVVTDLPSGAPGLERLVRQIRDSGGRAAAVRGDVSVEAEARSMVEEATRQFGALHVLVNNAAAPHGRDRADIEQVPLDAWEQVMAVNLRGVFLMSRAAVAPMRRQGWGRIVNVASAVYRYGARHRTAYAASKAAVVGFSRALAMDVASSGITVNAVCPGSVLTTRALSTTGEQGYTDLQAGLAERARAIPMGRHASAADVAASIVFLCSEAAAYTTGQTLFIDGGGLPLPAFKPAP